MYKVKKYPWHIYVIGVFVAWVIALLIAWNLISTTRFDHVVIFCSGFILGVLAASLARKFFV